MAILLTLFDIVWGDMVEILELSITNKGHKYD